MFGIVLRICYNFISYQLFAPCTRLSIRDHCLTFYRFENKISLRFVTQSRYLTIYIIIRMDSWRLTILTVPPAPYAFAYIQSLVSEEIEIFRFANP